MKKSPRSEIWILEDDASCVFVYREILEYRFNLKFFDSVESFETALLSDQGPSLVIADLRLPDGSFLKFLANNNVWVHRAIPFIVISSMDDLDVLKFCHEEGALDYLTKPFARAELLFKVKKVLEQANPVCPSAGLPRVIKLSKCEVEIDATESAIKVSDGRKAHLTFKEMQIMSLLWDSLPDPISRQEILTTLWKEVHVSNKTIDVHIFHLRKKIAPLNLNIEFRAPGLFSLKGQNAANSQNPCEAVKKWDSNAQR